MTKEQNIATYIQLTSAKLAAQATKIAEYEQREATRVAAIKTAAETAADTLIGHGLVRSDKRAGLIAEFLDPVQTIGRVQKLAMTRPVEAAPTSIGTPVPADGEANQQKRASAETGPRPQDTAFYAAFGLPAHLAKRPNA